MAYGNFPELGDPTKFEYAGVKTTNDGVAHLIIHNSGNIKFYYDVKTGVKIKESYLRDDVQESMVLKYSNNKEVDGIKFPHKITQKTSDKYILIEYDTILINEYVPEYKFR